MLTDDLVLRVALQALRTGIPVRHPPERVEHVDGVVFDTLHEQAEALLAEAQLLPSGLLLADVTGDLGKADELARGIVDRIDDHVSPHPGAVLADAPTLSLEAALAGCGRQGSDGQPALPILVGVEAGEVLADDLLFGVALEALRS